MDNIVLGGGGNFFMVNGHWKTKSSKNGKILCFPLKSMDLRIYLHDCSLNYCQVQSRFRKQKLR